VRWVGARLGRPVRRGDLSDEIIEAAALARPEDEVAAASAAFAAEFAALPEWWTDFDVLVTPSTFQRSWPLGGSPGPAELGPLAAPWSFTGQPALSLPVHWTDAGMPVGTQLVGRHGDDEALLGLALDVQDAADWRWRRPVGSSSI
jgi:amidase